MSRTAAFLFLILLAGCAGSHADQGPPPMAETATSALWSSRPVADVVGCLASLNGMSPPPPSGGAYTVPSADRPTVTYVVRDVSSTSTGFPTQVDIFGEIGTKEGQSSAACMLPASKVPGTG